MPAFLKRSLFVCAAGTLLLAGAVVWLGQKAFCFLPRAKKSQAKRKLFKRYAEKIAARIERDGELQKRFREDPDAVCVRERRVCGNDVSVEIRITDKESERISVLVSSDSSFLNCHFPASAEAKLIKTNPQSFPAIR